MRFVSPFALLLGLLMSGQGLLEAFENPSSDLTAAVVHFVVASVVAGIGISIIAGLVSTYAEGNRAHAASTADAASDGVDTDTSGPTPAGLQTDSSAGSGSFATS